jgi:uncharacterized protein (TIGR01619 family)
MTKQHALLLTLFLYSLPSIAQEDSWDAYMAQYEKGPGSTMINMALKAKAPIRAFPFLLKTGVTVIECNGEGLPSESEFDKLYEVSEKIKAAIDATVKNKSAGTFSYQCERVDYYYINDTGSIRKILASAYKSNLPGYKYSITIREDKNWEAYLDFLYPNAATLEYMSDQKVVLNLVKAGDDLSKPRQVDHWLYFKTEADRDKFILYSSKQNFKVESKKYAKDSELHYQLQISRTDKVDLGSITKITAVLRKKAVELNGDYDGWETFVIKGK